MFLFHILVCYLHNGNIVNIRFIFLSQFAEADPKVPQTPEAFEFPFTIILSAVITRSYCLQHFTLFSGKSPEYSLPSFTAPFPVPSSSPFFPACSPLFPVPLPSHISYETPQPLHIRKPCSYLSAQRKRLPDLLFHGTSLSSFNTCGSFSPSERAENSPHASSLFPFQRFFLITFLRRGTPHGPRPQKAVFVIFLYNRRGSGRPNIRLLPKSRKMNTFSSI